MNAARALGERHARMGIARPPVHLTPEQRREYRAGFYGLPDSTSTPPEPMRYQTWKPSPPRLRAFAAKAA